MLMFVQTGIKTNSFCTSSNRSSLCNGYDDSNCNSNGMNSLFRGQFIGTARAINDCIPCPYDRDALAFKVSVKNFLICRNVFWKKRNKIKKVCLAKEC